MVKVKYHCKQCGVTQTVEVQQRMPQEPIDKYYHYVGQTVEREHKISSKNCRSTKVDLGLELDKDGKLRDHG